MKNKYFIALLLLLTWHITAAIGDTADTNGIAWKTHDIGMAIGIKLANEININDAPTLIVFVERRGTNDVGDLIQSRERFILELNGKLYTGRDNGGKSSCLCAEHCRFDPPITVPTSDYWQIQRLYTTYGPIDQNSKPRIIKGTNRIRLHYKTGPTNKYIYYASGEILIEK
ncbi:MAG: hypothetical protein A2283_15865 [Lentisphaerae bacterium RIFOXYA12_FULL_48_11]|nr:MAG: hypothetical protein A2283_15865 [Lentisphaerae bacterium RIFOXYA12_FULL_48_11]